MRLAIAESEVFTLWVQHVRVALQLQQKSHLKASTTLLHICTRCSMTHVRVALQLQQKSHLKAGTIVLYIHARCSMTLVNNPGLGVVPAGDTTSQCGMSRPRHMATTLPLPQQTRQAGFGAQSAPPHCGS